MMVFYSLIRSLQLILSRPHFNPINRGSAYTAKVVHSNFLNACKQLIFELQNSKGVENFHVTNSLPKSIFKSSQ